MQPVNRKLNNIVYGCLNDTVLGITRNNEITFKYTDKGVPETGKAIHYMWTQAKYKGAPFLVFNGANDASNLYFSPSTNLLYRAVHDVDHAIAYSVGRGTTKYEDELYLNCLMAKRVHDWCLSASEYSEYDALHAFFAIYHDTVGQVKYYKEHGDFVVNQREHTTRLLDECKGMQFLKHGMIGLARSIMLGMLQDCGV